MIKRSPSGLPNPRSKEFFSGGSLAKPSFDRMIPDKSKLIEACEYIIFERMRPIKEALGQAREAANNETKSSAGDKHETSRAMAQGEQERLGQQLHQLEKMLEALTRIPLASTSDKAGIGSYVQTSAGDFFLSIGIGEVRKSGYRFYAINSSSPVGQQLLGCQLGDSIHIGKKRAEVKGIG